MSLVLPKNGVYILAPTGEILSKKIKFAEIECNYQNVLFMCYKSNIDVVELAQKCEQHNL